MSEPETEGGAASNTHVKAVETTFMIVEMLKEMGGGRVTEIANQSDLSKGAVYKHLSTLRDLGYVVKRDNEYALGFQFLNYGGWLRSRYVGSALIKSQYRRSCLLRDVGTRTADHALSRVGKPRRVLANTARPSDVSPSDGGRKSDSLLSSHVRGS